jgi:hypothetical protein
VCHWKKNRYLNISYDNGITYPTSVKLIDGKTSTTSDNYAFNHAASSGNTVGSPYTFLVPNGNTQIKINRVIYIKNTYI